MTTPFRADAGSCCDRSVRRLAWPSGRRSIVNTVDAAKRAAGRPSRRSASWRHASLLLTAEGARLVAADTVLDRDRLDAALAALDDATATPSSPVSSASPRPRARCRPRPAGASRSGRR
jgi:hypothetical protein